MLCTRCGGSLRSASAFCSTCGHPVSPPPVPAPAEAAPLGLARKTRWWLWGGGGAAVLLVAIIGAQLWPRQYGDRGGVPVLLTVISNPKTRVSVVSPDSSRRPIDLGDTPLDKASGALVGDTIVLENNDLCIHHEETIQFGEPYKEKIIEKVFGEGKCR